MQLIINSFGTSIHRKGELFSIRLNKEKVEVSARKVHSILITTGVHFTSDSILLASEHNIDVVLLDKYGDPYGRFWSGRMGSTTAIRRSRLIYSEDERGMAIVKDWVLTKIENQHDFLQNLFQKRKDMKDIFEPAMLGIKQSHKNLSTISGTPGEERQKIMGLEGVAAAMYWKVLGGLPPGKFSFSKVSTITRIETNVVLCLRRLL